MPVGSNPSGCAGEGGGRAGGAFSGVFKLATKVLGSRLGGGAFWSFAGAAAQKLVMLVVGVACAGILGKELFGELGLIRTTVNMFVLLGVMGMGMTCSKYIAEYRQTNPDGAGNIYALSVLLGLCTGATMIVVLLAAAGRVAEYLELPSLAPEIRVGAVLLFFAVMNGVQNGALAGTESFRAIALNTLVAAIVEAVAIILGAEYYGIMGALLGYGIGFAVLTAFNSLALRRKFRELGIRVRLHGITTDDFRVLYRFSVPAMLSSLMVLPVFWYIKVLLSKVDGTGELAIYEAADQWKMAILFLPSALGRIVLPILSNIGGARDNSMYVRVLKINLLMNIAASGSVALVVIWGGSFIMGLYGKDFNNNAPLAWLAVSTVFTSIATVVGSAIASRGKMWIGFAFNLLWGIMVVTFSEIFVRGGYGATALAMAVCLAYAIHAALQGVYLAFILRGGTLSEEG